jgi:uncharacterized protein (DUF58 family)
MTVVLAAPATAADSQVRVRSVEMSRGTVVLEVRLRCEGGGFMRWDVALDQGDRSDAARGRVRCSGSAQRKQLTLVPERGRFHPGEAVLSYGAIGPCSRDVCLGWGAAERLELSYRD